MRFGMGFRENGMLQTWVNRRSVAQVAAAALVAGLLAAAEVRAGRPLTIDDAEPVEQGHWELEAGLGYFEDPVVRHFDFPLGLTYGLLPRLEVGVGAGGQVEHRQEIAGERDVASGFGDLFLGAKWKVLDQERWWADQALAFTLKLPTADEDQGLGTGETDVDLTWILTRSITDKANLHVNVGYAWTGDDGEAGYDDILHYGVAMDYQLTDTLQPVLELAAQTPLNDGNDTAAGVNGGIRWQVRDNLTLDAAIGTRVYGDWPDLTATVGFTWAF